MQLKSAGADVVSEFGVIKGRDSEGFTVEAAGKEYKGARLLICTGSDALVPRSRDCANPSPTALQ